jgi:hypothetical protein
MSLAGSSELRPHLLLNPHYLDAQPPGVVVSHRIDVVNLTFLQFERALFFAVLAKGASEGDADFRDVLLIVR